MGASTLTSSEQGVCSSLPLCCTWFYIIVWNYIYGDMHAKKKFAQLPKTLSDVFDTWQMFHIAFLCSIFMHDMPVSLKFAYFELCFEFASWAWSVVSAMAWSQAWRVIDFVPFSLEAFYTPPKQRIWYALSWYLRGSQSCFLSKWPLQWLTMLRWPRHLWALQTRSECENKCSVAVVRLNTGSLCSILPFVLHTLNSCHNAALASVPYACSNCCFLVTHCNHQ